MPSYLDDTYLGQAVDDSTTEIGSADNMPAVRQDGVVVAQGAGTEMITLPGGIVMPRKTAMILLAIAIAIGIYIYLQRKKRKDDSG
jgi:hypothetical protein